MSRSQTAKSELASPTSVEANKALIRHWVEKGWNAHDAKVVHDVYAPDVVEHDPGGLTIQGAAALEAHIAGLMAGFPDVRITIDDLIGEGDVVVWRGVFHGTHKGTAMNIPATGKSVAGTGLIEFRFAGGKVAEVWAMYDLFGMLIQIGAIPAAA